MLSIPIKAMSKVQNTWFSELSKAELLSKNSLNSFFLLNIEGNA